MKRISLLVLGVFFLTGCESGIPEPPQLYSPGDGVKVSHPTFVWQAVGDEYQLQLSDDSTFATIVEVWSGLVDTTYTPTDSLGEGIYYWRVRGKTFEWGEWSEVFKFYVGGLIFLLSPQDADTIMQPTLVWSPFRGADNYHLYIYQGQPQAGNLVIDETLTDTFYQISDSLYPATHHWMIEVEDEWSDTNRFVTYTLDETYFPAGPEYEWEYMEIDYGKIELGDSWSDTSYYSVSVTDIRQEGDSLLVNFTDKSEPVIYRDDSVFNGHRYYSEGRGIKLFPEEGDSIYIWGMYMEIRWSSDTTFRYGYGPNWDFGEIYDDYQDYGKGLGNTLTDFCHGWRYHTQPEYSYWDGNKSVLIKLNKGE